jgi:TonB family protein
MIDAAWVAMLALAVSGVAAAAPEGAAVRPRVALPIEGVVTNPDWIERPSGEQVAEAYPPLAQALGLAGKTKLQCSVSVSQTLEHCRVAEESPRGFRFGGAALSLTPSFRMKPAAIDGAPVGGAQVNIPIRFSLPEAQDTPNASEGPASAPESGRSPTALLLARKLSDAMHWRDAMDRWVNKTGEQLRSLGTTGPPTQEEQIAIDALTQTAREEGDEQLRSREAKIANSLSDDQLEKILAFFTSPVGQAWLRQNDAIFFDEQNASAGRGRQMIALARKRLCAKISCLAPTPAN